MMQPGDDEQESFYRTALESVEDYVTRHYLDTRMGTEVLAIIADTRARNEHDG